MTHPDDATMRRLIIALALTMLAISLLILTGCKTSDSRANAEPQRDLDTNEVMTGDTWQRGSAEVADLGGGQSGQYGDTPSGEAADAVPTHPQWRREAYVKQATAVLNLRRAGHAVPNALLVVRDCLRDDLGPLTWTDMAALQRSALPVLGNDGVEDSLMEPLREVLRVLHRVEAGEMG